jgi:Transposase
MSAITGLTRCCDGSSGRELDEVSDEEVDLTTIFVGIDWGSEQHQVCVLDPRRKELLEATLGHSGSALEDLAQTQFAWAVMTLAA